MTTEQVTVVGAGLAGCEAAWQLAGRGVPVLLQEMKPDRMTPAHHSVDFAELVCSNSLRSNELSNAAGLLKEELRRLGGLIVQCADETQVEAGGALAVDREAFARRVTERIAAHPLIEVRRGEAAGVPREGRVIVATGPLTSDALFADIHRLVGGEFLHFYDAAAPIVRHADGERLEDHLEGGHQPSAGHGGPEESEARAGRHVHGSQHHPPVHPGIRKKPPASTPTKA